MITLHHLEYSQSFRILWLLEELGLDYGLKLYERDPKTRLAPKAYKEISPLGTAPVITDGDLTLCETNAIIDYLLDQNQSSTLRPKSGEENRTQYLFWIHAAQASLTPMLLIDTVLRAVIERSPWPVRLVIRPILNMVLTSFVKPRMNRLLELAEAALEENDYFAGDTLTAADIVMGYSLESAKSRDYVNDDHVNCLAWLQRVKQSASFKQAVEKDGKPSIIFWK